MKTKTFILLQAIFFLSACQNKPPVKTGKEGEPIPQFSLLLPDSTTYFNTKSIPPGKPVVMFWFNPGCPYCRAQVKAITEDINSLNQIQFLILTASPFSGMKSFYDEFKLGEYKNIVTGVDTSNFFGDYFEAVNVPYLAIYGKDHKLNQSFIGKTYISQIRKTAFQ